MEIISFNQATKASTIIDKIVQKQLPFAISKAINDTAPLVVKGLKEEMVRVFDNPTPYTINSVIFLKRATKQDQTAKIIIKDFTGKGTPPVKFLKPQIFGGNRNAKSSEVQMREKGILKDDMYWVPGKGVRLNSYGNITGAQMVKILSAIQAFREVGYFANQTAESLKRNKRAMKNLIVIKDFNNRSKLLPGVYQLTKPVRTKSGTRYKGLKPILIFIKKPTYKPRFRFYDVGQSIFDREINERFTQSMQYALSTIK